MMQIFVRSLTCVSLTVFLALNAGAIRKNDDPIVKTQTDPISLKDKLEETKDGVKGAPTPSFAYYGKEKFLVKTAVQEEEDAEKSVEVSKTAVEVSEVDFEEEELAAEDLIAEESSGEEEEEWWVEEEAEDEENPEETGEPTDLQG
jgi:hypothetical protein